MSGETPRQTKQPMRGVLTVHERRTLSAAVARLVLDPPDDLSARIEGRIATLAAHKIDEVRAGLRLFGGVVATFVSVRQLTPFHTRPASQQDRMLHAWRDSPLPQARTLFQLMRRLTLVTHCSDPRSYAGIGYRGAVAPRHRFSRDIGIR